MMTTMTMTTGSLSISTRSLLLVFRRVVVIVTIVIVIVVIIIITIIIVVAIHYSRILPYRRSVLVAKLHLLVIRVLTLRRLQPDFPGPQSIYPVALFLPPSGQRVLLPSHPRVVVALSLLSTDRFLGLSTARRREQQR